MVMTTAWQSTPTGHNAAPRQTVRKPLNVSAHSEEQSCGLQQATCRGLCLPRYQKNAHLHRGGREEVIEVPLAAVTHAHGDRHRLGFLKSFQGFPEPVNEFPQAVHDHSLRLKTDEKHTCRLTDRSLSGPEPHQVLTK